jgi:hypothetical protein
MKLEYKMDEQDFLDFQMFAASQSVRIKRKMLRGWMFITLGFGVMSVFFFLECSILTAIYFGVVAIIGGLFYPRFFRWRYKRHYKAHIRENYSNRFEDSEYIEINDETIFCKSKSGEGTINTSQIEKIDETEKHFFVKIKTGVSLIIPKYKIHNQDEVRAKFEFLGFSVSKIINKKCK